jgi:hypothetical protein
MFPQAVTTPRIAIPFEAASYDQRIQEVAHEALCNLQIVDRSADMSCRNNRDTVAVEVLAIGPELRTAAATQPVASNSSA